MVAKRKGKPKQAKKKSTALFDFLNDITWDKKNILNYDNQHAYSQFMICRFLSMYEPYLPLVDVYINKYQGVLPDAEFHKLCLALIPKKKVFLKYVKGTPHISQCKEQVETIADYFKVSNQDAYEYYEIAGEELVDNIRSMYQG
jgi:hypothetical protein